MSDEEDPWGGRESEEEQEVRKEEARPAFKPKPAAPPPAPAQKTEAQLAMEKRRAEALKSADENTQALLKANSKIRQQEEEEIADMKARIERRKAERKAEEARLAEQRAEEDARRKAEEEERKRKKDEEEAKRREARAKKMAEFEKWKNPPAGPNFVITKRDRVEGLESSAASGKEETQKSKEQLEAEKRAILSQRIQPLNAEGMGLAELIAKASELHNTIFRLESDKYDMETRFKKGQADMVELAERARQMSKGGKGKATRVDTESVDKFQERFGAPPKISLCSSFERRKDKRTYDEKHTCFEGPQYLEPVGRVAPQRQVVWGYEGPEYSGDAPPRPREPEPAPAEEQAAE